MAIAEEEDKDVITVEENLKEQEKDLLFVEEETVEDKKNQEEEDKFLFVLEKIAED